MVHQSVILLMFPTRILPKTGGPENDPSEKGPYQTFQSWMHTLNTVTFLGKSQQSIIILPFNIGETKTLIAQFFFIVGLIWRTSTVKPSEFATRIRAAWFVKLVLLVRILPNFKIGKVQCGGSEVWFQENDTPLKFNSEFTPERLWLEDDPASYWVTFQGRCAPRPFWRMKPVPMCFRPMVWVTSSYASFLECHAECKCYVLLLE